ncbi:MAG: glycosyltransferase family 4 protein [Flavobacteriales bacterium]
MKRILILSDINSAHTEKWVRALVDKGYEIHLFSLRNSATTWHIQLKGFSFSSQPESSKGSLISKLIYLKAFPAIRQAIKDFDPDFVHAHYASSYGLLGALSGFSKFYVSVWGSDVYDFPKKNIVTELVLKYVFKKASKIFSTGNVMAEEIRKYTNKKVEIVSFGINVNKFHPIKRERASSLIEIGVIKSLEYTYGIDVLIKAIAEVVQYHQNIRLRIVGGGSLLSEYKQMVLDLNLSKYVIFVGKLPYDKVVEEYQKLDIFVNPSRFESFGVSILEASSCGLPVIATRAGGQVELVKENDTGLLVEPESAAKLADAMNQLINDEVARVDMGLKGRRFVVENYTLKSSISSMVSHY